MTKKHKNTVTITARAKTPPMDMNNAEANRQAAEAELPQGPVKVQDKRS